MPEMPDKDKQKDYLTTSQAARLLSVSADTVLKWVKAGKVKSYRTLGGHFRIPVSELKILPSRQPIAEPIPTQAARPLVHQYCWEYFAGSAEIKAECKECITYRSRAKRCYELKDLPGGLGCLNLLCDTECSDCDYYKAVSDQGINVLVLTENRKLMTGFNDEDTLDGLEVRFASCEYEAALIIQGFRPDYVVVDCGLGKKRTAAVCSSLFSDIRVPVVRIILSSKTIKIRDYCDKEVFGWITKPFTTGQLKECIRGVPEPADEHSGQQREETRHA